MYTLYDLQGGTWGYFQQLVMGVAPDNNPRDNYCSLRRPTQEEFNKLRKSRYVWDGTKDVLVFDEWLTHEAMKQLAWDIAYEWFRKGNDLHKMHIERGCARGVREAGIEAMKNDAREKRLREGK